MKSRGHLFTEVNTDMSGGKKLLFACVENARRSQMAEGFAEVLEGEKLKVYRAGSSPSSVIDPLVL